MADDPVVPRRTKQARWMLKQSEKALRDVLDGFDAMRQMMLAGEQPSIPDLSKARVALGHARSQLLDEVNKYERHIFLSEGLTAEAPIDLDAIKDQIGSSLDRIRDAQDADGVSERSEE
ncbi:MAG: hypothetical protein KJP27_10985 [Altererythrobacter sp.]|nr:hypothetical protein [Altererythrobacter sp.]